MNVCREKATRTNGDISLQLTNLRSMYRVILKPVNCFAMSNDKNRLIIAIMASSLLSQPAFTCSKSRMETPEQYVESVQS